MKKSYLKTIIFVIFIILIIIFCYYSSSIVKPIFFSALIAYMLKPAVDFLVSKGLNKKAGSLILLFATILIFAGLIFYIIPGIAKDVIDISGNIGKYTNELMNLKLIKGISSMPPYLKNVLNSSIIKVQEIVSEYLSGFSNQVIDFSMELPTYVLAPIFIYYFLSDTDYILNFITMFIPEKIRCKSIELGHEIDRIIGSYIRSQLLLSAVVAILTFAALLILKIRYPLMIAFINGITNIIPYFGPIIGFIPILVAALSQSINKAIIAAVVFFTIQEFESGVIAPKLVGDSIGIHPVFIMVILLIGGKYFGVMGMLFSIPLAGIIKVTYNYLIRRLY